jgi:hypothetical protein
VIERNKKSLLAENCLVLAPVSKISLEARAETGSKIAVATSRAVTSFGTSIPAENIFPGRALLLRTIRATVPIIALAPKVFVGVPWSGVCRAVQGSKSLLGHANSTSGAIIGAKRALAGLSVIILEAPALSRRAIAKSLVGAFHSRVSLVLAFHNLGRPGITLGTSPQGAIMRRPRRIAIGTVVAGALV